MELSGLGLVGIPSTATGRFARFIYQGFDEIFSRFPLLGELYSVDFILSELSMQNMQLWILCKEKEPVGFVITQLTVYPKAVCLEVPYVYNTSGEPAEVMQEVMRLLEDFGKAHGCTMLGGWGRKGWVRACKKPWMELSRFVARLEESHEEVLH